MSYTEDLYAVSADSFAGCLRTCEAALGEASIYWARQWGRGATPFDYAVDTLRWYETWARRQTPRLAESFYLGLAFLSWQGVVLGDPLCSLGKP